MAFFEFETWKPREGLTREHDEMVRRWFEFVKTHHDELFAEWRSARYFRLVDRHTGQPTGRYAMLFEYVDYAGFLAYKERRKDWAGPYAEYKKVDPYQFFEIETVTEDYWLPNEQERWLDFSSEDTDPGV